MIDGNVLALIVAVLGIAGTLGSGVLQARASRKQEAQRLEAEAARQRDEAALALATKRREEEASLYVRMLKVSLDLKAAAASDLPDLRQCRAEVALLAHADVAAAFERFLDEVMKQKRLLKNAPLEGSKKYYDVMDGAFDLLAETTRKHVGGSETGMATAAPVQQLVSPEQKMLPRHTEKA